MGIPHVEERPDVEQHGENLETEPSGTTTLQSVFQRLSYIPEIEQYSENHPERTPSTTPIQDTFLRLSPCGSPSSTTENNGPQDTAIQRILFRLTNETNPSGDVPPPPGSDLQRTFSRLTHRM